MDSPPLLALNLTEKNKLTCTIVDYHMFECDVYSQCMQGERSHGGEVNDPSLCFFQSADYERLNISTTVGD